MPLRDDDRGVSAVVGFILVFGILVLLLTIYQSQVVPAQNEGTEFEHSQTVQRDMIELRNALLTARTTGETQFAEVQLGTQYETRIFAINPPPPSGALRTGDPEPVVVEDGGGARVEGVCAGDDPPRTRTLNYTPFYSEYAEAPTIVYENTVLYLQFEDRTLTLTDQQLVENGGDTVNLVPLNTSYQRTSSETVSVEAVPGRLTTTEVSDATVTTPTRLSESAWEDLLAGQVPASDVTVSDGNLTVQTSGTVEVACAQTGVNDVPTGGERGSDVENVRVRGVSRPANDVVEVTFNNTDDEDVNATRARIPFYHNPDDTGGDVGPIEVIDPDTGNTAATLVILDDFRTLEPTITFEGNGTETTVTFRNTGSEQFGQRDFFIVDIIFENGVERRYFIDVPA